MKIMSDNGTVKITDLSSNGTFVNGKLIGKGNSVDVTNGDEICFVVKNAEAAKKDKNLENGELYHRDRHHHVCSVRGVRRSDAAEA